MRIKLPEFSEKRDLFQYLRQNKSRLVAKKKELPIWSDPVTFGSLFVNSSGKLMTKANEPVQGDMDTLRVKVVANTANWIDSHMDLLLPDAPAKSITERKGLIPHLHDHVHKLEAEIGEVADIYLTTLSLLELGLNQAGTTQVLIFVTDVMRDYNPMVFQKYKAGKIKQHSIGLQYVKLELAINDPDYKEEKAAWDKYYPQVINKDVADAAGYFWPVPEYKLIENSAVLFGSNILTPTLDNNMEKIEPLASTQKFEPPVKDTRVLNALESLCKKLQV